MENIDNPIVKEPQKSKITNIRYFEIIKQYKNFNGRADKKEYWVFILLNIIITVLLSFIWNGLGIIFVLLVLMPTITITVRRLHDLNREGWFIFIPIYSLILLFKNGTDINTINDYGPPLEESKYKINLIYFLTATVILLIIGKTVYIQQQNKKAQDKKEAQYISKTIEADKQRLKELNEASLKEIEQAQTLQQISQVYQNAPKGSESSLVAAIKWISLCQSSIEIKDANSYFAEYSEASIKAIEKWKELTTKELEKAQSVQDAKFVYENAPEDDQLKTTIYNKWNELSLKTVDQLQTVKDAKGAYDNSPIGSQAKTKITQKWKELSLKEIDQTQNFQSLKSLYSNLPEDNEVKIKALTKWISFCQTAVEAKEVYPNTINNNDLKRLSSQKWKELTKKETENATTVQELRSLYTNLPPEDDKLKSNLLLKWISLSQTAKEMKEVYPNTLSNSEERKTAFDKWDALSLKEIEQAQTLEQVKEVFQNTPENSQSRTVAAGKIKELQ